MTSPEFAHRIAEAAAGRALPVNVAPPPQQFREPPQPTASATVAGVKLAPASRLSALAAVRDGHRAAARAASDRMHTHREEIESRRRRLRLIQQHGADLAPHLATQAAAIEAEIEALVAARGAAHAEAEGAAAAAGAAHRLLQSCLGVCVRNGITVPILLAAEVHAHA